MRLFLRSFLPFCLFLVLVADLDARKVLFDKDYDESGDVSLNITSHFSEIPPSGYLPVRITARNKKDAPKRWGITFKASHNGEGELLSKTSLALPPGKTADFDFLIPLAECLYGARYYYSNAQLRVEVNTPRDNPQSEYYNTNISPKDWPSLLLSEDVYRDNASKLEAKIKKHTKHGNSIPVGATYTPKLLSDDWRAYSGFDAILLTPDDWRDIPAQAKAAIKKWNRMGGHFYIVTKRYQVDMPSLTKAELQPDIASGGPRRSGGEIRLLHPRADNMLAVEDTVDKIKEDLLPSSHLVRSSEEFHVEWSLVDSFGSHVFSNPLCFIILFLFAVLVGPLNLFVFAKRGKRHRLFITTPLISIGASLLLFIVILTQDGIGGKGVRVVHLELRSEAEENNAYLYQEQIIRTGILFKNAFQLPEGSMIRPVLLGDNQWARLTPENPESYSYRQNLTKKPNELSGDYFQSRSEQAYLIEQVRPSRIRLQLEPLSPDGSLQVSSTIPGFIDKLYYCDTQGKWWYVEGLAQGNRAILLPCERKEVASWLKTQGKRFSKSRAEHLNTLFRREGHFIALSTDPQLALDSLSSIKWEETRVIITGNLL